MEICMITSKNYNSEGGITPNLPSVLSVTLLSNKEGIYNHCNIDCREGTVPKVRPNSEEAAPLNYVRGTETLG